MDEFGAQLATGRVPGATVLPPSSAAPETPGRFASSVGADIARDQVEDCRRRFAHLPAVSFCELRDLAGPAHTHAYAVVTCMEVLEHCPEAAVREALRDMARLVAPGDKVILSVPIETGLSFLLKYGVRTVAGEQVSD